MESLAVIFDCDGTIIDTEDQTIISIAYAVEKVDGPAITKKQIHNLFGPGIDKILTELIGDEKKALEAFDHFIEHQKQVIPHMLVYPGIRELLLKLKNNSIPVAMVTGRHERDLELIFKAHQLGDYFNIVIPDSLLKKPKPDPEGILLACEKLKISPQKTYYVGDAKTDIEAAKAAGAKSIAALWDHRVDYEVMRLEKPDVMAENPMSIATRFKL